MIKDKKGFTLIELITVIVILSILLMIGIPSISRYIDDSRKNSYIDTAINYTEAVRNKLSTQTTLLKTNNSQYLYLIPVSNQTDDSCVVLESGGDSPYSDDWVYAYVGVTFEMGKGYKFYFLAQDGSDKGISFQEINDIKEKGIDSVIHYIELEQGQTIDDNDEELEMDTVLKRYYDINGEVDRNSDLLEDIDKPIRLDEADLSQSSQVKNALALTNKKYVYIYSSYFCKYGINERQTKNLLNNCEIGYMANEREVCEPIEYTISYRLNGGRANNLVETYNINSPAIHLPQPVKQGFRFKGWTGTNGFVPQYSLVIPAKSYGNKTYIANFEAITCNPWETLNSSDLCVENQYSITYILNDGSMPSSPTTYKYSSADITLPQPTKQGYVFLGWIGSNGVEPKLSVTINNHSYGDRTYTALYKEKTCAEGEYLNNNGDCALQVYSIAYNLNGGSLSNKPTSFTKASNDIIIREAKKTGYNFIGWTGSNGIVPETTVTIPTGSMGNKNYTAVFAEKTCPAGYVINESYGCDLVTYKIDYNTNGGTLPNPITSYTVESDTFSISEPTKLHYHFIGWTGSNGVVPTKDISIAKGSYGDRSYTAVFTPLSCPVGYSLDDNDECIAIEYTITYDLDGGTTTETFVTTYTIETENFTIPSNITKSGVDFAGWTGSNGTSPRKSVTIVKGTYGNLNYFAQYTSKSCDNGYILNTTTNNCDRVEYTITYNLNDGIASGNPTSYNVTTNSFNLNMPTKIGYEFLGWTGSNGLVPQKTVTIPKGSYGNKSYAAIFSEISCDPGYEFNEDNECEIVEYSISYTLNGGTVSTENPTTYNVNTETFVLNNPTKNGYTFAGWTGSNGNTTAIGVAISKGSTGNRNYIANYTEKTCQAGYTLDDSNECVLATYTITYTLNGGTISGSYDTTYNIYSETIVLPHPTKEGYVFAGWTGSNGIVPQKTVQIDSGSTGNRTYSAIFTDQECSEGYDLNTTIYECEPHNYDITYSLGGGYFLDSIISMYTIETSTFTLPRPVRAGYEFAGWTGSNGVVAQQDVIISTGTTGDKTYTAVWTTKSCNSGYQLNSDTNQCELTEYLISYDLDDGTLSGDYRTTYNVLTPTFTLPTPTKEGYFFFGWTGSNGSDPEPTVTIPQGTSGNLSYYANFDTQTFTITYNLNGGSYTGGTNPNPTEYNTLSDAFTLLNPSLSGYTFVGWTGSNGSTPQKSVTVAKGSTGNKVYTANYAPICPNGYAINPSTNRCEPVDYSITFNANGGSGGQTATLSARYGDTLPEITTIPPTRDGYQFLGWYDNATNGNQYYNASGQPTKTYDKTTNLALFAHWAQTSYTITYHLNGGTAAGNPVTYTVDTTSFTLTTPVKSGYQFVGWSGTGIEGTSTTVTIPKGSTGNREYSAVFRDSNCNVGYVTSGGTCVAMTFTVTFNSNGGSGGQSSNVTATYGQAMPSITSTKPAKDGYTFGGWYDTESVGGTQYYSSTGQSLINYNKVSDTTLYARWIAKTFTVTFNSNGGTGGQTSSVVAEYGHSMPAISTTAPRKNNYRFLGWYDSTSSNANKYYDSNGVGVRNYDKTSGVELYAIFEQQTYNVSFNTNGGTGGQTIMVQAAYGEDMPTISTTRPIKSGVQFMGWFDSCSTTGVQYYTADGTSARKYDKKADVTLLACWDTPQYNLFFDSNGGRGGIESLVVQYNELLPSIASSSLPTREGFVFAGYYDDPENGTKYYNENGISSVRYLWPNDATLYAHWEGEPYTCSPGQYLSATAVDCRYCNAGNYCPGGTYFFDGTDKGIYECGYGNYCPARAMEQTSCPDDYNYTMTTTSISQSDCHMLLYSCNVFCRDLTSPDGMLYVTSGNVIVYDKYEEALGYSQSNPNQSSAYQKMDQTCNNSKDALCTRWNYGDAIQYTISITSKYYGQEGNFNLCIDNPAGCVIGN